MTAAKVTGWRAPQVQASELNGMVCAHPLAAWATASMCRSDGDHVTDDTGTGFVTAPGHGADDYNIWIEKVNGPIPFTVDADGYFTKEAPGFTGKRVITDKGEKGDANDAVIRALIEANALIARGRLKHQYPHSWRSRSRSFSATRRSGSSPCRAMAARHRAEGHRRNEVLPRRGPEPLRAMIEQRRTGSSRASALGAFPSPCS